jgi:hypothetical protein
MSSHPTDFKGSVVDAPREAIERQIPSSHAEVSGGGRALYHRGDVPCVRWQEHESQRMVYGAIAHLMKGDAPPVRAVDSLRTRTPATS